ncbi:JUPI2 protein, partial [Polypterus senegalus]
MASCRLWRVAVSHAQLGGSLLGCRGCLSFPQGSGRWSSPQPCWDLGWPHGQLYSPARKCNQKQVIKHLEHFRVGYKKGQQPPLWARIERKRTKLPGRSGGSRRECFCVCLNAYWDCVMSVGFTGGKDSGIFKEPESGQQQTRSQPPGGKTSNIFGGSEASSVPRIHPNKPKDTGIFVGKKSEVNTEGVKPTVKPDEVQKPKQQELAPAPAPSNKESEAQSNVDDHEPRLGPRPRSHNKVIQPPGGKSSVVFY